MLRRLVVLGTGLASVSRATSSSSTTTMAPHAKAGVVFMHGLGDSPAGWSSLQHDLGPKLASKGIDVTWSFPAAPNLPVTINGGAAMPSWFDIMDWPISLAARDDREGLLKAVARAHAAVNALEAKGIPSENIVVGGFSQGGAIALLATYRYPKKLGACVALSGWLTLRDEFAPGANAGTPCFWGHGTTDDKVLIEQQTRGVEILSNAKIPLSATSYPMGHSHHPSEMIALAEFLSTSLSHCASTSAS